LMVVNSDASQYIDELKEKIAELEKLKAGLDADILSNPELVSALMAQIGRQGGRARNPKKGFGSLSPDRRRQIAEFANATRWRRIETLR